MSATFTLQVEAIDSVDLTVTLKVWATAAASILDTAFTRGFVLSSLTNGPYGASKSDYEKRNGMIASWAKSRYKNALANEAFPSFLYEEDPSKNAEKEAYLDRFCTHVEVLRLANFARYSSEIEAQMWARAEKLHAEKKDLFEAYQHYFLRVHMSDAKWATAYAVGDVIESSSFEVFPEDSKNPYTGTSRFDGIPRTLFRDQTP
jgi:hypothetical protein